MNTKLHAVTDRDGRPVSLFVTADQVSDYKDAFALQSRLHHRARCDRRLPIISSDPREAGFDIEYHDVIIDHSVSGVSVHLKERGQGRRLYDLLQAGNTLPVRWVDIVLVAPTMI